MATSECLGWAIFRGKGKTSPVQLGLRLILQLPEPCLRAYRLQELTDGGFASQELLTGPNQLKIQTLVRCAANSKLKDGSKEAIDPTGTAASVAQSLVYRLSELGL
ncbi:MAG: hypothetical protein AAGE92_04710 [Cyanobacteria bacterium P01_G01_bin.4]